VDNAPRPDDALVAAERIGYLRDAIAELPERPRHVVTGYYLENRQLTDLAADLSVTQSRASQLRAEGLELLREALSQLLPDDARVGAASRAGAGPTAATTEGVRTRRREAYSTRSPAVVSTGWGRRPAYLDSAALHREPGRVRPAATGDVGVHRSALIRVSTSGALPIEARVGPRGPTGRTRRTPWSAHQ
jgi:hypothetical protein